MDAYACFVAEQGYAPSSIRSQIVVIEDFGRWLRQKHIDVSSLDRGITDRFLRTCRRPVAAARRGEARTLDRLLLLLRQRGVVQLRPDQPIETARQRVVEEFRRYLLQERRLSPATPHNYVPVADQFLSERFAGKAFQLSAVRAVDVTGFIRRHAHQLSPGQASLMVTALRSFFRYLLHRGEIATDLAACVPTVPRWSFSSLPRFLSADAVQLVLNSCDRQTSIGRRNYAILLLLARLGLRAGEVVTLDLDDIDWKEGLITIRGKGGKSVLLPLPIDVGEAIANYLRRDRPRCSARRLFIRHRAPHIGFQNSPGDFDADDACLETSGH
jgi:site-specific recombinase XerD